MVSLSDVRASNARIAAALPPRLVAVFVGATSGIGEFTVQKFAKYTREPRVYIIGRSQQAADRIVAECAKVNPGGRYSFIKADVSLLRNVDDVCRQIRAEESAINVLMLSQGTLAGGVGSNPETSEGLHLPAALAYYSRYRFILNLLPLLQRAESLRRVVTVLAATREGAVSTEDMQGRKSTRVLEQIAHTASMTTLALEKVAEEAPEVSFIHDYPGSVKTGITRGIKGPIGVAIRVASAVFGTFTSVPSDECGDRHVYLVTSAMYPPAASKPGDFAAGVATQAGIAVARGIDGKDGSGVYSIDSVNECASTKVEGVLQVLKDNEVGEKVWDDTLREFRRITGKESSLG